MQRRIWVGLLILGLATLAVVPAHASFNAKVKKPKLQDLAHSLVPKADIVLKAEGIDALRKQASAGDAHAQYLLGATYLNESGSKQYVNEGLKWLRKAADQGEHDAMAMYGAYLFFQEDDSASRAQGLGYLKSLASQGKRHDILVYGVALMTTDGPPSNWSLGLSSLEKAAAMGEPSAPLLLGIAYTTGHGVSWNPVTALNWYRKALQYPKTGILYHMAQFQFGMAYMRGRGVGKDEVTGATLIRKAAKGGLPYAAYVLSLLYVNGEGVPKDSAKAMKWMQTAAHEGLPDAKFWLGMNNTLWRKSDRDYKKGIPLLQDAALHGFAEAYSMLGIMHLYGMGFTPNLREAAKSWMQGAKLGSGLSAFMLANLWRDEHNLEGDAYTVMWLAISVKLGFAKARKELVDVEKRFRKSAIQKGLLLAQAWLEQEKKKTGSPFRRPGQ